MKEIGQPGFVELIEPRAAKRAIHTAVARWRSNWFVPLLSIIILVADVPFALGASPAGKRIIESLQNGTVPVLQSMKVKKVTLSNGMKCFLAEDHLLPLFRFRLLFAAGSVYDPPDKVGLSNVLMTVMRTGGTLRHSPAELDEMLDSKAIEIALAAGFEQGSAVVRSLAESKIEALRILFEMLYAPAYDPDRVELALEGLRDSIKRRNDNPVAVGNRIFRKILYGPASPWARVPSIDQVNKMSIKDLKSLHSTLLTPQEMVCAAAGDFNSAELIANLESLLARYPERGHEVRTPPQVQRILHPGVWVVDRQIPQSVVNIGSLGISRDNPDKFPLTVMNEILGGAAFTSWLMDTIRTKRGLAYEVWSQIKPGPPGVPGMIWAHAKTRRASTGEVVNLIRQTIADMKVGKRIKADEVARQRDSILRRLIFEYEDPYQIVTSMQQFVFYGLPANYLEMFREKIGQVTLEDVRRVAGKYLESDNLTVLVVGDAQQVVPQLEQSGPVMLYPLD